jgi:hypothetical protein
MITSRVRATTTSEARWVRVYLVMDWCIATLTKRSYECRAMQLLSLLWAYCLPWADSVSMTESGSFRGCQVLVSCDQLVSMTKYCVVFSLKSQCLWPRKKLNQHIFRQIVLNQHIFSDPILWKQRNTVTSSQVGENTLNIELWKK